MGLAATAATAAAIGAAARTAEEAGTGATDSIAVAGVYIFAASSLV